MKKILLAGGGHGHINILKEMDSDIKKTYEISLISDYKRQFYSGMLPGFIEGIYTRDEISFDISRLCKEKGVEFIQDTIVEVDDINKIVTTKKASYPYDYLSLNLGSQSVQNVEIGSSQVIYTKPIENLVNFKFYLDENLRDEKKELIIVGGGAAGVELALAFNKTYENLYVKLLTSSIDLIPTFNNRSQKTIKELFYKNGIGLLTNEKAEKAKGKTLYTNNGAYEFDYLILATGTRGPDVSYKGLETDEKKYLKVNDFLMASESSIAMGDMVSLESCPKLPKAGVFAIREAPILTNNLKAMLNDVHKEDFKAYKPQTLYLQIINTGGKKGLNELRSLSLPWKSRMEN